MSLSRRRFLLSSATALGAVALPLRSWGQDPASRAFTLFDTHAHLVSLDIDQYPRTGEAAGRDAPDADPAAVPTAENLIAWMDEAGIEAAAVVQKKGTYGYDNRYIIDSSRAHPDRLVPVVVLDSLDPNTRYIVEGLAPQGIAAVRFTGVKDKQGGYSWLESRTARSNWAAIEKHGIGIELMYVPPGTDRDALRGIARMARAFQGVRIVIDHLGWPGRARNPDEAPGVVVEGAPDYGLVEEHLALAELPNVYYKLTPLNLDDIENSEVSSADWVRHMVDVIGADRIMWGSNVGQSVGAYSRYVEQALRAAAKLSETEKRQVLHDTGRSFHEIPA